MYAASERSFAIYCAILEKLTETSPRFSSALSTATPTISHPFILNSEADCFPLHETPPRTAPFLARYISRWRLKEKPQQANVLPS
jgi:hypothetical protein